MKYMVGYQLRSDRAFMDTIVRLKEHVAEVYFSWFNIANGRNKTIQNRALYPWETLEKQISDLDYLSENGIRLNLLLNGNCYGAESCSKALFARIKDSIRYCSDRFGLVSVTTTSPLIAAYVKETHPRLEVRASVNMDIGTIQGMDYVKDLFDSYYLQREYNRDAARIQQMKNWCDAHDKRLYLLANSGCLNHCSARTFHDNLVSHEDEIARMENAVTFESICSTYLKEPGNWVSLLRDTSFIRPEEMYLYEPWFDTAKLATRVHAHPERVLEAYAKATYSGSVPDLCEPNHAGLIRPFLLENRRLPADFNKKLLSCSKDCATCRYCETALKEALVDLTAFTK